MPGAKIVPPRERGSTASFALADVRAADPGTKPELSVWAPELRQG